MSKDDMKLRLAAMRYKKVIGVKSRKIIRR